MEDEPHFEEFVAERADALLRYGYLLSGNPDTTLQQHLPPHRIRREPTS
ncbi:hypothetical protein ACTWPT_27630 [Nonomuraea sp. 3N208]